MNAIQTEQLIRFALKWKRKKQQQIGLLYTYDEGIKDPRNI